MPIDFDQERWEQVKTTYRKWWAGELGRPIVPVQIVDRTESRPEPQIPLLGQDNCHDFSVPTSDLIDRLDWELSHFSYLGDAYPAVNFGSFGPGVVAAFLGAKLDNSSGRVWFHAPDDRDISDIHFEFDPENKWFKRIKELYEAGIERWQGNVMLGMTDLGGNLDIVQSFRPGESLLFDVIDKPDEVKRLTWEAHEAWHKYFSELNNVLQPMNPGYSSWGGWYSETPAYMLQCDFCYMIGPDMFDEFVKPELTKSCQMLDKTIYHLDGIGSLNHIDSLLSIEELDGVQWVPGDGQPRCHEWPDVYKKIVAAGKRCDITTGTLDEMDIIADQVQERLKPYGID